MFIFNCLIFHISSNTTFDNPNLQNANGSGHSLQSQAGETRVNDDDEIFSLQLQNIACMGEFMPDSPMNSSSMTAEESSTGGIFK